MKHYVCAECKGVSKTPGVCSSPDCPQQGAPLQACFCSDGRHAAVLGEIKGDGNEDPTTAGRNITEDSSADWKNDDVTEDEKDDEGQDGPEKTLDLDRGDDAIE